MAPLLRFLTLAIAICLGTLGIAPPCVAAKKAPTTSLLPSACYTKREVMIPMRDGVKLFTAIYLPKDRSCSHPILITRTPYGSDPYGANLYPEYLGPSPFFSGEGYIVVSQDVRGRYLSEGNFAEVRPMLPHDTKGNTDESTDTYDTIQWLLKHVPNHNGKVGIWGISYPGFYAAASLVDSHPALKAVSPQAPMIDLWEGDDTYHHGAFMLAANFNFYRSFCSSRTKPSIQEPQRIQVGTRDGYAFLLGLGPLSKVDEQVFKGREPLWKEALLHDRYDQYWKIRNLRPYLKKVTPAVFTVGGWYDAENLFGSLECHKRIRAQSPDTSAHLVMGPWSHGQWAGDEGQSLGIAHFPENTCLSYQRWELDFFNHHLKQQRDPKLPLARMYDTGAKAWRDFDEWPPRRTESKNLFLAETETLSLLRSHTNGFREFVSDPAHPVPFSQSITLGYDPTFMAEDQRFVSARPDVLVFQTEALDQDLCLAGPIRAVLHLSTTGTDSDWVVKLIDVFPENAPDPPGTPKNFHYASCQMLVRGNVMRGKYRNSFEKPEPFIPNQITELAFNLPDVFHTFRKGHRIMIQVQCTWFPWVDRNPQTFCRIPEAKPEDFKKATQRVYYGPEHPSRIEVMLLER